MNKNQRWFSRTPTGYLVLPVWLAFFIGGKYRGVGYNWYPGILRITIKYFIGGWYKHRSYFEFTKMSL